LTSELRRPNLTRLHGLLVFVSACSHSFLQEVNRRWFGLQGCFETRSSSGVPVTPTLQGLEACTHDLILQLDVDILLPGCPYDPLSLRPITQVAQPAKQVYSETGSSPQTLSSSIDSSSCSSKRANPALDSTLLQLAGVLLSDPAAISISLPCLPVPASSLALPTSVQQQQQHQAGHSPSTDGDMRGNGFSASFANPATNKPWRVEVRGCLLHRGRLIQQLPLPAAALVSQTPGKF
jgi:hypothetical protein